MQDEMSPDSDYSLFLSAMRAMADADETKLREIYHDAAEYWDPVAGSLRGEAIAPYLAKIGSAYARLNVEVRSAWTTPSGTAIEWTQTSQEPGKDAVGLLGATFLVTAAGQITVQRDYFDFPPRPKAVP